MAQIKRLEDWFKAAEAIQYLTGEGSLGESVPNNCGLFNFNVSKDDLKLLKASKKLGPSRKVGDESLQSSFFEISAVLLLRLQHLLDL